MDPKKLPAPLAAALSLVTQGCIATVCLSVSPKDTSPETLHTGDVFPCLIPPLDHTGSPEGTGHTGGSGTSAAAVDRDGVLDRLPGDVRARLRTP